MNGMVIYGEAWRVPQLERALVLAVGDLLEAEGKDRAGAEKAAAAYVERAANDALELARSNRRERLAKRGVVES